MNNSLRKRSIFMKNSRSGLINSYYTAFEFGNAQQIFELTASSNSLSCKKNAVFYVVILHKFCNFALQYFSYGEKLI